MSNDVQTERDLRLTTSSSRPVSLLIVLVLLKFPGKAIPLSYHTAHLLSHLSTRDPLSFLTHLSSLESRLIFPPQSTYTTLIAHLLKPSPYLLQTHKSLAWDLFTHMRLVAHPEPTEELYGLMIKSCADSRDPKPEMALDWWIEMKQSPNTLGIGGVPSRKSYTAIILALAKVKKFYTEALRLFGEMIEIHTSIIEAGGEISGYEPTLELFTVLLEGTKRNQDLPRARWILSMAVNLARSGEGKEKLSEAMVVGAFHTYATTKAKIGREAVVKMRNVEKGNHGAEENVVEELAGDMQPPNTGHDEVLAGSEVVDPSPSDSSSSTIEPQTFETEPYSTDLLDALSPSYKLPPGPQTSNEILLEASRLFGLIVRDADSPQPIFERNILRPRLIDAYLSVHFAHNDIGKALELWNTIWDDVGGRTRDEEGRSKPNGWSFVHVLENLAELKSGTRERYVKYTNTVWQRCEAFVKEQSGQSEMVENKRGFLHDLGLGPREVEKAWRAVIKFHAL